MALRHLETLQRGVHMRAIFDCWQGMHDLAHSVTCLFMLRHTNLLATIVRVVRTPGCDKLCTISKTDLRQPGGTTGRGVPVETSHQIVVAESNRIFFRRSPVEVVCKFCRSLLTVGRFPWPRSQSPLPQRLGLCEKGHQLRRCSCPRHAGCLLRIQRTMGLSSSPWQS